MFDADVPRGWSERTLVGEIFLVTLDFEEARLVVEKASAGLVDQRGAADGELPGSHELLRKKAGRLAVSRWRRCLRGCQPRITGRPQRAASPALGRSPLELVLRRLSHRQRLMVVLFYIHDLPLDSIGDEIGVSAKAVRRHLSRARAALLQLSDDASAYDARNPADSATWHPAVDRRPSRVLAAAASSIPHAA